MKKLIIFILILGIFNSCCKDCTDDTNPDCSNYNPCKGKIKTTASFKIYDRLAFNPPNGWVWQDTDTVSVGAVFEADMPYQADGSITYEWHIGAGVYYNRKVEIPDGMPLNSTLSARLIVRNSKVDKKCFPNDDGADTFTRVYYTTPTYSRMEGIYRGAYTSRPFDSIDFVFRLDSHYTTLPLKSCRSYYAINWINNGTATLDWESPNIRDTNNLCFINFIRSTFLLSKESKTFSLHFFKRPNSVDTLLIGRKIKSF